EYKGKAEIGAMLHYIYHVAFEAKAVLKNYIVTEDKALVEGDFQGKHIGEFAGVQPTFRDVNVPLSVSYDLKDGLITKARIYMLDSVLMQQLGVSVSSPKPKTTFVIRDIFYLKFGHFKDAKKLLEEATQKSMLPEASQTRILTDFTGDAYRLIFEEGYDNLGEYELSLNNSMRTNEWQDWYERFKPHVERSHREILKQII
ncbi:MAG TPA: hypothetical protein VGD26_09690, partial [Chitinophagaceae bacterium]